MTLSPLGIFSAAGAGGVAPVSDFVLLETNILGSAQTSITFSNLGTYSPTYRHLQIRAVSRGTLTATGETLAIRFNGDTGTSYTQHGLEGNGSTVVSFSASPTLVQSGFVATIPAASATANSFGVSVLDILDPYSSTKNKVFRALSGSTGLNRIGLYSGLWTNTASLTSITLFAGNQSFVAGSRFSLYGIKG